MRRLLWNDNRDREQLIDVLKKDGVAICSTDTIYGFLADVTSTGYQRISELKQVKDKRPFLVLIACKNTSMCINTHTCVTPQNIMLKKLSCFVDNRNLSGKLLQFLGCCWPGPVTVIFDALPDLPDYLKSQEGTIAIRCPKHEGLLSILPKFDGLFSTSANRARHPAPSRLDDVDPELIAEVDCVVLDKSASKNFEPSTIIDISGVNYSSFKEEEKVPLFKVIREGLYPVEKLKELYEQSFKWI